MPRTRTFGGDVTAPPGQTILVAAPLNGTLKAPARGVPPAGSRVKNGDPVFELLPLLSPDARSTLAAARVDAEGQVNTARVQVEATKIALDRANELVRVEGGRQRDVDDAQALYDAAVKTLDAAQARLALLTQAVGDADKGTAAPLPIEAPTDGLLRTVSALAGAERPVRGGPVRGGESRPGLGAGAGVRRRGRRPGADAATSRPAGRPAAGRRTRRPGRSPPRRRPTRWPGRWTCSSPCRTRTASSGPASGSA